MWEQLVCERSWDYLRIKKKSFDPLKVLTPPFTTKFVPEDFTKSFHTTPSGCAVVPSVLAVAKASSVGFFGRTNLLSCIALELASDVWLML